MGKGAKQASWSYLKNHQRFFDWAANMLDYPIVQDTSIGYVRSPLDRQKLVDYMQSLVSDSVKYGQVRMVDENQ